jgi:hypothetical protein
MQAQEWDKFTNQLASLKRAQSPQAAAKSLKFVSDYVRNNPKVLAVALDAGGSSPQIPKTSQIAKRWNTQTKKWE